MSLTRADYRPARRPRRVPTGTPRRKVPLIRVALLITLGVFIAARFDDYWPKLREWFSPAAVKERMFGKPDAFAEGEGAVKLAWSEDSLRITAECSEGITAPCCAALSAANATLCGAARAGLAKARWRGKLGEPTGGMRIDARAHESEDRPGDLRSWSVASIRGRDARGEFNFRRAAPGREWCDAGRGCLDAPSPRAPLQDGRLLPASGDGLFAQWTSNSTSPRVLSVLPGRIVAIDTLEASVARIRIWHGMELYTSYEPVIPADAARPGARVRAGSHLGDLARSQGARALIFTARQAGVPVDASLFWEPGAAVTGGLSARALPSTPAGAR